MNSDITTKGSSSFTGRFSVAPMLDWTNRHCRYFHRILSKQALLYTEMVTTGALIQGKDSDRFLKYNPEEHPVALQLGGSNPEELAICAQRVEDWGYDEINLNVGCPSDRVQNGSFGACLMLTPIQVAKCVEVMQKVVQVPVTVKNRIGVDEKDSWEDFYEFIRIVREGGCNTFIIHARKAWLQGLSPKENRTKPPLHYDFAYRIKEEFPDLSISINGNINSIEQCVEHLQKVDGVMLGRAAYENPEILRKVDSELFGEEQDERSWTQILGEYSEYIQKNLSEGVPLHHMTKPLMGLFQGQRGARVWRRILGEEACRSHEDESIIQRAFQALPDFT